MNFSTITDSLYYVCHSALPRFPLCEFQGSGRSPCLSVQICTTSRRGLQFTEVNTIEIWPSAVTIQPLIIFVVLISCAKLVTVVAYKSVPQYCQLNYTSAAELQSVNIISDFIHDLNYFHYDATIVITCGTWGKTQSNWKVAEGKHKVSKVIQSKMLIAIVCRNSMRLKLRVRLNPLWRWWLIRKKFDQVGGKDLPMDSVKSALVDHVSEEEEHEACTCSADSTYSF